MSENPRLCVCGHPKSEHDKDGMCTVDYLLCPCAEWVPDDSAYE
jgi:hypothetical protein